MSATSDSLTAAVPKIFNLDEDVLLHIFHLNTYTSETEYSIDRPYQSSPLHTVRHTSQVCHAWRQITLGSPSIWASVIDLRGMGCREGIPTDAMMRVVNSDNWANRKYGPPMPRLWLEEVLRRTGDCNLSIFGTVDNDQSCTFLTSFLAENWHRVERLDVLLDNSNGGCERWALWNIFLHQPAPNLEKFILMGMNDPFFIKLDKNAGPFFGDFAPSIRRFHCTSAKNMNYRATWTTQLSSLTLANSLSFSEMLDIMSTTRRLDSLVIIDDHYREPKIPDDWTTQIHLPCLRRLHIKSTVTGSLLVLRNIVTHQDCALRLHVEDNADNVTAEEIDQLAELFVPYAQRYYNIYKPPRLFLGLDDLEIYLRPSDVHTDLVYFTHPVSRLRLDLWHDPNHIQDPVEVLSLNSILPTLASIPFGCITELEFPHYSKYNVWVAAEAPRFLEAFSSVQTLIVSQATLDILGNVDMDASHLFPLLKVVRIIQSNSDSLRGISLFLPTSRPGLLLFLSRRMAAGHPALTLDLNGLRLRRSKYRFDLRFLDVITGLKVVWKNLDSEEVEYVCGSGEKGKLNWGKRYKAEKAAHDARVARN